MCCEHAFVCIQLAALRFICKQSACSNCSEDKAAFGAVFVSFQLIVSGRIINQQGSVAAMFVSQQSCDTIHLTSISE